MAKKPSEFKRNEGNSLSITWSDGATDKISSIVLRKSCPCATCKEKRGDTSHAKPLGTPKRSLLTIVEASSEEETKLIKIWPVGNYALGIEWGDGHSSGIYPYALLAELTKVS